MKLKFRAEGKDWALFGMFCLLLLYLVAIAVLNISSFAKTSTLHGLNPFPAFGPKYLLSTIVFFFAAVIGIIVSCSSYIFERDSGIGLSSTAKKEKGYSNWASKAEMKKELVKISPKAVTVKKGGIPLMNNGKEIWIDTSEYHNLIIGSTGSGKTECVVQPMVRILAKAGESMIITDPKGEIYEKNADTLRAKGYNIVLLNFRDPQKGNSWNPLELPYRLYKSGNVDKASELLDDLASNIMRDEKAQNSDPFWENASSNYFVGLALGMFEDANEDEINLNSISLMATEGEEKYLNTTYIKEYFTNKSAASSAYENASTTILAPSETKGSILSVFKQKLKIFASRENLSEMLGHNDFDMKEIGTKRTAVFIIVQDEKKTYHGLVTIFLKQCYETLIDVAQDLGRKLPYRTNFILDEFANMPPLKDVDSMISAARSRNIRFTLIIQNYAQLDHVYSKEVAGTIKGNCGNTIYLISTELTALEEISKLCGEVKSKDKDKTASTPLVTVSDLQRLPMNTLIILRLRKYPFKTSVYPDWKMNKNGMWDRKLDESEYPTREKQEVKTFDVKAFVRKKHEEKMNNLYNDMNPGVGGGNSKPSSIFDKPTPPLAALPKSTTPAGGGFDIDAMVKKIDAKIAALEAEEKNEKNKKDDKSANTTNKSTVDATKALANDKPSEDNKTSANLPKNDISKPEKKEIDYDDDITADQFFDDFFADDDD